MNKKYFLILFILIITAIAGFLAYWHSRINQNKISEVCFKNNCYSVEIAKTDAERERGLMHREHLDSGRGMLFIFEKEDIYPFWMKNTLIPLDMIWLDKDKKVVYIAKNNQLCEDECPNITPPVQALYVFEINAGQADKIGLKEADKLDFE